MKGRELGGVLILCFFSLTNQINDINTQVTKSEQNAVYTREAASRKGG